jgi:hypothetical protein
MEKQTGPFLQLFVSIAPKMGFVELFMQIVLP